MAFATKKQLFHSIFLWTIAYQIVWCGDGSQLCGSKARVAERRAVINQKEGTIPTNKKYLHPDTIFA
jgi:hypothetical protein